MHSSWHCSLGCPDNSSEKRGQGGGERAGRERRIFFTCSRRKSWGLKSFGEHPHQSTMCLYWHLQPSFRFQLVTRRLLSTSVSQMWLFSRTVWKKDCARQKRDRTPSGMEDRWLMETPTHRGEGQTSTATELILIRVPSTGQHLRDQACTCPYLDLRVTGPKAGLYVNITPDLSVPLFPLLYLGLENRRHKTA